LRAFLCRQSYFPGESIQSLSLQQALNILSPAMVAFPLGLVTLSRTDQDRKKSFAAAIFQETLSSRWLF
jgi:hypothetical protein